MIRPGAKALDDLAGMAGGAVSVVSSIRTQIRNEIRARMDEMATNMDLVPREDYERLEERVEKLTQRLEQLEKSTGQKS